MAGAGPRSSGLRRAPAPFELFAAQNEAAGFIALIDHLSNHVEDEIPGRGH